MKADVGTWPDHTARWGSSRRRARLLLAVMALAIGSSACAKARAESAPDGPPLQVPEPPARVIGPVEAPLPATVAAPETPPPAPPRPPARPPVPRAQGETKPEPPPPAPVAAEAPPPGPGAPETRDLRAAPDVAGAERNVHDLLTRAARDLSQVDYARLSPAGRSNYDQSKRFSQQAELALKERNYVFASTLADKAATLAAELLRR